MVKLRSSTGYDRHGLPVSLWISWSLICQFFQPLLFLTFQSSPMNPHGHRDNWLAKRTHDVLWIRNFLLWYVNYMLKPRSLMHFLCASMRSWQFSSPFSMMQASRGFFVSGQAQQGFKGFLLFSFAGTLEVSSFFTWTGFASDIFETLNSCELGKFLFKISLDNSLLKHILWAVASWADP